MFKVFKTMEEKDKAFIEAKKAKSYNLDNLIDFINKKEKPFEISCSIYSDQCLMNYKRIRFNSYQDAYLALKNDELFITTLPIDCAAYTPITIIYSELFPQTGTLRERMSKLSCSYRKDFKENLERNITNNLININSVTKIDFYVSYFGTLHLNFTNSCNL